MFAGMENESILSLDYLTSTKLVRALGADDSWRPVAEYAFGDSTIVEDVKHDACPPQRLLAEMHYRGATVGDLCTFLAECDLLDALTLLKEPEPVKITSEPVNEPDETVYVPLEGRLMLECKATGLPPPHYQWLLDNQELHEQTSSELIIDNFSGSDEGFYSCHVTQNVPEQWEEWSWSANVKVHPTPPTIVKQPPALVICQLGESVTLECEVLGYPMPEYQWLQGNTWLKGETSSSLTVTATHLPDEDVHYSCLVKNEAGETQTGNIKFSVYDSPYELCETRCVAKAKLALLIGNEQYDNYEPDLQTPSNDVAAIADKLMVIGFRVLCLKNLTLSEMQTALIHFCSLLSEETYGFFYFAGHGFEINNKFMLPTDAPGPTKFLQKDSMCGDEVICAVMKKRPQLFVILLDMCLKKPRREDNPGIYLETARTFEYQPMRNLVQGFSTTSNLSAFESKTERNGVYARHLKQFLTLDIPIGAVLERVRAAILKEPNRAADSQMPFDATNLAKRFFLTDPSRDDEHTEMLYRKLTCLPSEETLVFTCLQHTAVATFHRHKGVFHNAWDIRVTSIRWRVNCFNPVEGLKLVLRREQQDSILVITVHNLQRTEVTSALTLSLLPADSDVPLDTCLLPLRLPLW